MLVDVPFMRMVEMAVVQVVGMPAMAHRRMAAAWSMLMGVAGMLASSTGRHKFSSFPF